MLRLDKIIKPWKESAALNDHINLYGFWNETAFLTKSGDLGMVLQVQGVDYESLDTAGQEYAVKRLESALKAFGQGFHVYQYLFKANRPEIPFANYDDPIVEAVIEQRRRFFESKRDNLYQIEIFYVVLLEGARSKRGIGTAIARLFSDPSGAIGELQAQFSNNSVKTLLRLQIETDLARLDQRVQAFTRQLADFVKITLLDQQGQFTFLRRLLNFDSWRIAGSPQSTQFLDYQVVNSNIEAERDHLRVGDHQVRILTMKEAITETRPLVLDSLLKIPANFIVCTEWTPLPASKARKEVNKRRRHFNMSKTAFVSQMGNDVTKTNPRDVLVDESKQADIENLGDCLRALGDGQSLGDFSLSIVIYGDSKARVDELVGEFVSVFTNADGNLFTESYNQLNAYFATVPGNYALNLRRLYLLNSNYADLSFLFTILPGETRNAHLGTEYLAVLETDNSTPYFLNLHNDEVAHTLILGMTGSGKSYFCNFLLQNAQKYAPQTYIFDIGGSFQSLTTIFGGSYSNVGQDARDFTINPFSLAPTKENTQFLFSFFRVLIEGNGQRYRMDFKEERRLWDAIERIYVLEPERRTVSSLGNIIGELKERLHRWTKAGQYGFLFDNPEDTLSFSQFQTFNFAGWGDAPEVLEPLLFYVLHRASNEIADPKKLATFKMFLLDEAWLFIKNETIRNYIVSAQKTWRKHNAAMILATQSIKELEESGMLQIVSESCPTKIFLANPEMDRSLYREAFHLNDTELDLIAGLVPPGQMLIRKAQTSKKVQLNVDSVSHWTATNNARDNLKKRDYFERFGIAEGLRRLAQDYPFQPRKLTASPTSTNQ
ncbi:MAG: type IV secretion system DNA-binding domain-containing protein [Terracidiphilus sp.]